MKKFFGIGAALCALLLSIPTAKAQDLLVESFDFYSNSADFEAAWQAYGTNAQSGSFVFDTGDGHSSPNSVEHPGDGTSLLRRGKAITVTDPSDETPLNAEFWIRANGTGQGRFSLGLSDVFNVSAPIELGVYNAPAGDGWFVRTGVSSFTWTPVGGEASAGNTTIKHVGGLRGDGVWKKLVIQVKESTADIYEDDVLLGTVSRVSGSFVNMGVVSFGGFTSSNNPVTSAVSMNIDDIRIYTGPLNSSVGDWNLY